jgi:hypothetical protein
MTIHTIKTQPDAGLALGILLGEIAITYDYSPGTPDTMDRAGYPDEIDFILAETDSPKIGQDILDAWAAAWLEGVGFDLAVANATRKPA